MTVKLLLMSVLLVAVASQQCVNDLNGKLLSMMISQEKLVCYRKAFNPGSCPRVATMKGFNITGILGEWYMIAHFSDERFMRSKCIRRVFIGDAKQKWPVRVMASMVSMDTGERQVGTSWVLRPNEKDEEFFVIAMDGEYAISMYPSPDRVA